MKRFLERICPDNNLLHIDARVQMYSGDILKDGDLMESPFGRPWDFVVDAIDDVTTKALLLEHCIRQGIRVIR
jgi:tRNA A37 threonylcarbamoyladenosine dehydratase